MTARPNIQATLARLKDFQRRSVEYVFRRLYADDDHVHRFLLADEVGLGKTLVARGVIARAIDHLWDRIGRIDVVYICSNADIARQNINRLRLDGQADFAFASRLSLLPLHTSDLTARKLNFVSFTPGTSFELGTRCGVVEERALLYQLLEEPWALSGAAPKNVLQGNAGTENWRNYLRRFREEQRSKIDPKLALAFATEVQQMPDLRERFMELCERFQRDRNAIPREDRQFRARLIGELRHLLAKCCIRELQPDLVILDEFQRFRHLLHGEDEVAELARELFEYCGDAGDRARVLLLSATPYKMYTLAHEAEDDHYRDFLQTARFLFESEVQAAEFERELRSYRAALCLGGTDLGQLADARQSIERRLRKVMCRTERLAVSGDRNGMLAEVPIPATSFGPEDARGFAWIDRVAGVIGASDCIELWKSGAYLLNFMDDYELKRKLKQAVAKNDSGLRAVLREAGAALFRSDAVQRYEPIDAGNARLRSLLADSVDRGGWKLLWMPPSLPYYAPDGVFADPALIGFTKALVFSSWQLVPKVIAVIGSYEAERRMVRAGDPRVEYAALRERRPLLRFAHDEDRLTGMPLLTLFYPCATLAQEIDPLAIGRQANEGALANKTEALSVVTTKIRDLVQPLIGTARKEGPPDERWYWAALLLLDRERYPGVRHWLDAQDEWAWRFMAEEESHFAQHVDLARHFLDEPDALGPPPADLFDVLAKVALASPAVVALRALGRRWPEGPDAPFTRRELLHGDTPEPVRDHGASPPLLAGAAWIAMGFRALFNRPEAILLIRGLNTREPYWERILDYAIDGNLQSVVDEYVHVLVESLGLEGAENESALELAERIYDAVSLRTITLSHDEFALKDGNIALRQHRLRCRYALRFGEGEAEDGGEATREDQVRSAFNSPFRPFILASTSVGQEGLDFHLYCRAVYHWNLPSNPVDLEQREGRVHRYKGHVIRKNVASRYGLAATANAADPWDALFARAATDREAGQAELVPYWVFEGPWTIERRVPLFPLSRETARLEDLKRSLALYRLVFGQPRQEELLRLLQSRANTPAAADELVRCRIDLAPDPVEPEEGRCT